MSKTNSSDSNLLSLLGGIIVILLFIFVFYFGYLPQKAEPVNSKLDELRINKANESVAKGTAKLQGYKIIDQDKNIFQIPIERASDLVINELRN